MLQIMGHFLVYEPGRSVKYDTLSVMASSDGGQNLNNSLISKILDTAVNALQWWMVDSLEE